MADGDIVERLVTEWDANTDKILSKLAGLNKTVHATADGWDRRFSQIDLSKALGRTIGASELAALDAGVSKVGALGAGLGALGPIGIGAAVGIGAVAAAANQAKRAMEWGEALELNAKKIGVTVEALQQYDYVASQSGITNEAMRDGLERLNVSIGKVQDNLTRGKTSPQAKAFNALGITPEDLKTFQNAADLLPVIANRIREVRTSAEQAAIAKVLGIQELLPLLKDGGDKLAGLRDEAERLGVVLSHNVVANLADAERHFKSAASVIDVEMKDAFVSLAPAIIAIIKLLAEAARGFDDVSNRFRALKDRSESSIRDDIARREAQNRDWMAADGGPLTFLPRRNENPISQLIHAIPRKMVADNLAAIRADQAQLDQLGAEDAAAGAGLTPTGTLPDLSGARARKKKISVETPNLKETAFAAWLDKHPQLWGDVDSAYHIWQLDQHPPQGVDTVSKEGFQTGSSFAGVNPFTHQLLDDKELDDLRNRFASEIRGGLEAAIHGGWPGLVRYMAEKLQESLLDAISKGLANWILGQSGGNPAQAGGGGLLSFFAGVGHLFGFAGGTDNAPGGWSIVGENGPEALNLRPGSQVLPNSVLRGAFVSSGMGAQPAVHVFSFDMSNAITTPELLAQVNSTIHRTAATYSVGAFQAARGQVALDMARRASMQLR